MINRRPSILYYDHNQPQKRLLLEKSMKPMGISLIPITPEHFHQTVGYLAKIKGFPAKKLSPLEIIPQVSQEIMLLCDFPDDTLNALLQGMKNGSIPHVPLKAVLTPQNCFWTFAQLSEELAQEHQYYYGNGES